MNGVMRVSALILQNIVSFNTVFIKNPEEPVVFKFGCQNLLILAEISGSANNQVRYYSQFKYYSTIGKY